MPSSPIKSYICTAQSNKEYISTDDCAGFYCEARMECLPQEVVCDGVLDCYDDEGLVLDELNCESKFNKINMSFIIFWVILQLYQVQFDSTF